MLSSRSWRLVFGSARAFGAAVVLVSTIRTTGAAAPRDPLKVPKKAVLVTTTIELGDEHSATITEFFTGDKSEKTGINILVGIHRAEGDGRSLLSARDYNAEAGGYASRGSLEVVDLDRDGVKEILVTYHHHERVGETRIDLDVLRIEDGKLVLAWTGPVRVDTTSSALALPGAERERFVREIGYLRTAADQGRKIHFSKTVSVAAGVALDPPRVLAEEFDLARAPRSS